MKNNKLNNLIWEFHKKLDSNFFYDNSHLYWILQYYIMENAFPLNSNIDLEFQLINKK